MLIIGFWLLGLILVVLQTTLLMFNPLWPASPDLYFILIGYLAYRHEILLGLIILLPLSMLYDVISGMFLGMYPAIFLIGYLFLKCLAEKLPVRESLYQIPMIGVGYLVSTWIVYVVMDLATSNTLVPWSWPLQLLRMGLIILLALPFFRFFEWFSRRLHKGIRLGGFGRTRARGGNRFRK